MHDGEAAIDGDVLVPGEEDDYSTTVVPRLKAIGADLKRISQYKDELITPARGLQTVVARGVKLLVIDPLTDHLGTDSNREQSVRTALVQVAQMAMRHGVVVLALRHCSKSGGSAGHAGLGSVGINAAARSVLLMAPDPTNSGDVIIAQTKTNLGPLSPSLHVRFNQSVLEVVGVSSLGADAIGRSSRAGDRPALQEAIAFLREVLACLPRRGLAWRAALARRALSSGSVRDASRVRGAPAHAFRREPQHASGPVSSSR